MVPWWQVPHLRSFRQFAASFSRKARPRSIAFRPCCGVEAASGEAFFLRSSERAGLTPAARIQSAVIAMQVLERGCIVGVLEGWGGRLGLNDLPGGYSIVAPGHCIRFAQPSECAVLPAQATSKNTARDRARSIVEDAGAEGARGLRRLGGRLDRNFRRRASLALDDIGGVSELDDLVGAGRIDGPAACGQSLRQFAQLGSPLLGCRVLWANLHELAAQKDQPQQVAKDDALLLDQVARLHIEVEVALVALQLPSTPDRLREDVRHIGEVGVEQQPQLLRQRRRVLLPLVLFFLL